MADNTHDLRPLPDNPDLEWLRKEAKRRLRALQATNPDARLADAQFDLAKQYGFPSWRALKSHIDGLTFAPLVASALGQAEQSPPPVKAAALLSLSRIVSASDRAEGMRLLERGIALAYTLRDPTRLVLLSEAFTAAAMLSPDHAFRLLPEIKDVQLVHMNVALYRMMEHGHHDAAIRYLLSAAEGPEFPFDSIDQAVHATADIETQRALLRKALRAFRHVIAGASTLPHMFEFLRLFNDHWRTLPAEEATAVVRELAAAIVAVPNDTRGTYSVQDVRFTSTRQHSLFLLSGPCRHLDPQLADRLAAEYPQLAKAIARYPNGPESRYDVRPQPPAESAPPEFQPEPDLEQLAAMDYLSLDEAWVPVANELRTGFERSFAIALHSYAIDTNRKRPNTAPPHCWPSAHNFRSILYKAGQYEGHAAIRHLDRVPDPALRLFAQIELAAAVAGIQQLGSTILNRAPEHLGASAVAGSRLRRDPPYAEAGVENEPVLPMPAPFQGKPDVPPSSEVRISPSRHDRAVLPTGGRDADFWVIEGARLRPVLAELFEMSPVRIVLPGALEDARYDFTLVLPREESREVLFETMRAGVEKHFKVARRRRTVDVQIVTAARGVQAYEVLGGGEGSDVWPSVSGGSFECASQSSAASAADFDAMEIAALMDLSAIPPAGHRVEDDVRRVHDRYLRTMGAGTLRGIDDSLTMTDLCLALEASSKRIFVDETGTAATYRINLHAGASASDAFLTVLCDELGLTVTPGRREIEMLVVEGTA